MLLLMTPPNLEYVAQNDPREKKEHLSTITPSLKKRKRLQSIVQRVLTKHLADSLVPKGSRLPHLYGVPKIHKIPMSVRSVLSDTKSYNYSLAKWLDKTLKPLSVNQFTITDTYEFTDEIHKTSLGEDELLVSYDVSSLFSECTIGYDDLDTG